MKAINFKENQTGLYEEVKDYINPVKFYMKDIPTECSNLVEILENKGLNNSNNAKLLAVACSSINDGMNIFHALMQQFSDISQESVSLIYEQCSDDVAKGINYPVKIYKDEVKKMVKENRMSTIGFIKKENGKGYYFNANIFVRHMMKRATLAIMENGTFIVYKNKGYFEIVDIKVIGKVIRYLMHEVQNNIWLSSRENEILRALALEVPMIKELNPMRNYYNVENGMLNIDTLELIEHSPKFLSSVQTPIPYVKGAVPNLFLKCLDDITLNDRTLVAFIQELFGYVLTCETKAEKAFMFYGTGSNGKSLIAKIIRALVGEDNCSSISLEQFSQQFGLENLIGKTLNIASENELSSKKMNTESIKAIISGDPINIQIKYKTALSYIPICKLLFLVNTLPDTMDNTYGYYRKMEIVPFKRKFTDEEKELDLFEKLQLEMPGILNWALEGLHRLKSNNFQFTKSNAIEDAKKEYEEEQNPVLKFCKDCLVFKKGESIKKNEILVAYDRYLRMNSIDDKGSKSCQKFWKLFKAALDKVGQAYSDKKINGYMHVKDVSLRDEFLNESDDLVINF